MDISLFSIPLEVNSNLLISHPSRSFTLHFFSKHELPLSFICLYVKHQLELIRRLLIQKKKAPDIFSVNVMCIILISQTGLKLI